MNSSPTKVIAITGSIGTGKSTVAWMFGELGIPVLDADEMAHKALEPKSSIWKALFERFGKTIMGADEIVDRTKLAKIVFTSPADRKFLESLVHPFVRAHLEREVRAHAKQGVPIVMVEVPLLFEVGWADDYDAVIVVTCDPEVEIARCQQKFGMSRDDIEARLTAQLPLDQKIQAAHAVIDNNGTLETTRIQVQRLYQEMVKGTFPKKP